MTASELLDLLRPVPIDPLNALSRVRSSARPRHLLTVSNPSHSSADVVAGPGDVLRYVMPLHEVDVVVRRAAGWR